MRQVLVAGLVMALMRAGLAESPEALRPDVRWRGFNLLEMFTYRGAPSAFKEEDFRLISGLGFNFVRLPLDYRFWIKDGQWDVVDEAKLAAVDQAVAWGKRYGIHVQLCFHRAPGYTVAKPPESRNLFADDEALKVCCQHWRTFARRYKGVSSSALSFNLFNEPDDVTEEAYEKVALALVASIRAEDPARFIVADGIAWGGRPVRKLFGLGVGQAMRGYCPMSISHYRASWVGAPSDDPVWPPSAAVSPLYGPIKAPLNVPLVVEGLPAGRVALRLGRVSGRILLRMEADGEEVRVCDLEPKIGAPGWTNVVYRNEWRITQGECLSELPVDLPRGARRFSVSIPKGDWAALSKLTFTPAKGDAAVLHFDQRWGHTNGLVRFKAKSSTGSFQTAEGVVSGVEYLRKEALAPWQPAFDAGIFVMVGEFGAFRYTPHEVVLAWMEDNLKLWQEKGLGWALWNFRGPFGVLDSERVDVVYETFRGHKLDRQMLELLLRY